MFANALRGRLCRRFRAESPPLLAKMQTQRLSRHGSAIAKAIAPQPQSCPCGKWGKARSCWPPWQRLCVGKAVLECRSSRTSRMHYGGVVCRDTNQSSHTSRGCRKQCSFVRSDPKAQQTRNLAKESIAKKMVTRKTAQTLGRLPGVKGLATWGTPVHNINKSDVLAQVVVGLWLIGRAGKVRGLRAWSRGPPKQTPGTAERNKKKLSRTHVLV